MLSLDAAIGGMLVLLLFNVANTALIALMVSAMRNEVENLAGLVEYLARRRDTGRDNL